MVGALEMFVEKSCRLCYDKNDQNGFCNMKTMKPKFTDKVVKT